MTIHVRELTKRFQTFTALHDVSFDVAAGSLTALIGPSGSGKSTLLRIIAGLESPDHGVVTLNGIDVTHVKPQSRGVGFVFQQYAMFPYMTVWENVAFGLRVRKRPEVEVRARVAELLELVELGGFGRRYPSQLSGGQQQRVALARALATRPSVLLLDEPFGALDPRVRQDLRESLRRLQSELRTTTLLVTHDQREAMEIADYAVVLSAGRVQQSGSPQDLYERPANAFVMSFVGPVTRVDSALERPHDIRIARSATGVGWRPALVERIVRLGFEVRVQLALHDGQRVWSQISRHELERLRLSGGSAVFLQVLNANHASAPEVA